MMATGVVLAPAVVHVIEDDASSAQATARVLKAAGLQCQVYESAPQYLASPAAGPGCIVLDLCLPGVSGLELQQELLTCEAALPILFLTGYGDVPKTAQAMKAGAVDFLVKPVEAGALLDAVYRALARDCAARDALARRRVSGARYQKLTLREREVFAHVISGQLNKQIASDLGTSEQTIKVLRHRVMEKLEAQSVPELVRLAWDLGVAPVGNVT